MLEPQYDIDASPGVVLKSCTGPAHPISNRGAHAAAQTVPTLKVEITTVAEGESGANRVALPTTTIAFAPNETIKTVLFVTIDDGMSERTEVFGSIVGSVSASEATVEPSTPAYVTESGTPYRFVLIQDNDNRFRLALTFENPEADLMPFAASESRGRRLIGCLWQRQVSAWLGARDDSWARSWTSVDSRGARDEPLAPADGQPPASTGGRNDRPVGCVLSAGTRDRRPRHHRP